MNQTLIKNINIWTMDEEDTRFYGWVLLENGKIASMGEGETPDCESVIDGEGGVLTPGLDHGTQDNHRLRNSYQ